MLPPAAFLADLSGCCLPSEDSGRQRLEPDWLPEAWLPVVPPDAQHTPKLRQNSSPAPRPGLGATCYLTPCMRLHSSLHCASNVLADPPPQHAGCLKYVECCRASVSSSGPPPLPPVTISLSTALGSLGPSTARQCAGLPHKDVPQARRRASCSNRPRAVQDVMAQCRRALRPNGLFLSCMWGGDTLHELRAALTLAEQEVSSGISQRVSPLAQVPLPVQSVSPLLHHAICCAWPRPWQSRPGRHHSAQRVFSWRRCKCHLSWLQSLQAGSAPTRGCVRRPRAQMPCRHAQGCSRPHLSCWTGSRLAQVGSLNLQDRGLCAQVRDAGNLLTRAGLTIHFMHTEAKTVHYSHPLELVQHLRWGGRSKAVTCCTCLPQRASHVWISQSAPAQQRNDFQHLQAWQSARVQGLGCIDRPGTDSCAAQLTAVQQPPGVSRGQGEPLPQTMHQRCSPAPRA